MERRTRAQLLDFIGDQYNSHAKITRDQFLQDVKASTLPEDTKSSADEIPAGEYSKQRLLATVGAIEVPYHPVAR